MMVSFNVSPFEELVTLGSVNPITRAPCCGFKTESCTGGGFEEKSGDYSAIQNFTVRLLFKLFCHLQKVEDFLFRVFGNSN